MIRKDLPEPFQQELRLLDEGPQYLKMAVVNALVDSETLEEFFVRVADNCHEIADLANKQTKIFTPINLAKLEGMPPISNREDSR